MVYCGSSNRKVTKTWAKAELHPWTPSAGLRPHHQSDPGVRQDSASLVLPVPSSVKQGQSWVVSALLELSSLILWSDKFRNIFSPAWIPVGPGAVLWV